VAVAAVEGTAVACTTVAVDTGVETATSVAWTCTATVAPTSTIGASAAVGEGSATPRGASTHHARERKPHRNLSCMCSPNDSGDATHAPAASLSAMWANLRQPGPLGWKLQRLLANTAIKVGQRQGCCGHAGEPGC
jgi:predicted metal-binding membrane protein